MLEKELEIEYFQLQEFKNSWHKNLKIQAKITDNSSILESICSKLFWSQSDSFNTIQKPYITIRAHYLFNILAKIYIMNKNNAIFY